MDFKLWVVFVCLVSTASGRWGLPSLCGNWRKDRVDTMSRELEKRLYGQPMVVDAVEALREHVFNPHPETPLSMSFHGDTGVGKTYLALEFIEKELRGRNALFSNGVLTLHGGTITNKCHKDVACAKDMLIAAISSLVRGCPTSLIVIDEVEDLEPGAIDAVASLLDNHASVDGVDYRRCVFIFTSNVGLEAIGDVMFERLDAGRPRRSLKHADFDHAIGIAAFEGTGNGASNGFLDSQLLSKHRIDRFVVFLPLFKEHVRMCLSDALAKFAYEHSATGTATPLFAMLSWSDAVVEEMLSEQKFLERDVAECVPPSDVVAPPRIAFPSVSQRWTRTPRSRARRSHALAFSLTL